MSEYNYQAFISYKHHADIAFSKHLERALKTYAKPLLKPAFKIFRDENHLSPGVDLPKLIQDGLRDSAHLILLASKEAAESEWVQQELHHWCAELKRTQRLIIILTKDVIAVDDRNGTIDWTRTTALPPLLRDHLATVPLYADLSSVRSEDELDLDNAKFRHVINAISARFRGVDPNDMMGEEVLQHRRNMRRLRAGLLTMAVLAVGATGMYFRAEGALATAVVAQQEEEAAKSRAVEAQKKAEHAQRVAESAAAAEKRAAEREKRARQDEEAARSRAVLARDEERTQREVAVAQRKTSESRALAMEALSARRQPDMLELAIRASSEQPTVQAQAALRAALLTPRLLWRVAAHDGRVDHVAFSPNGQELVTASRDGTTRIWDTDTGEQLATLEDGGSAARYSTDGNALVVGGLGEYATIWRRVGTGWRRGPTLGNSDARGIISAVHVLAFSPDDRRILMGRPEHAALFRASDGDLIADLEGHLYGATFSRDGQWILAPDMGDRMAPDMPGAARVWNASTGTQVAFLVHPEAVYDAKFDSTGRRIVTACQDGTVRIFERASDQPQWHLKRELPGHAEAVKSIEMSPDGEGFATATFQDGIGLWNLADGARRTGFGAFTSNVRFGPLGRRLFYAEHGAVLEWQVEQKAAVARYAGHGGDVISFAPTRDGSRLVSGGKDGVVALWSTDAPAELPVLRADTRIRRAHQMDERLRAVGKLSIWQKSGEEPFKEIWPGANPERPPKNLVEVSSGIRAVLWRDRDNAVWHTPDVEAGRSIALPVVTTGRVNAWLSDDGQVAALESGEGNMSIFWPQGPTPTHHVVPCGRRCDRVTGWSKGAVSHVVVGGNTSSTLVTRSEGSDARIVEGMPRSGAAAFSPDGRLLALQSRRDRQVQMYSTDTGDMLWSAPDVRSVRTFAFDRRSRHLLAGSSDSTFIWRARTGNRRVQLEGAGDAVADAVFSPDGRRVLTEIGNGQVALSEVRTGKRLEVFAHRKKYGVGSIQFVRGGTRVQVVSDGKIWRHLLTQDALLAEARTRLAALSKRGSP